MATNILVVEDSGIVAQDIQESLCQLGYEVPVTVASGEDALDRMSQAPADLVVMDIRLKGALDGVETAEEIRERFKTPIVYLSAYSDPVTVNRAKASQPFGYLLKPFQPRELATTVELALHRHQLEQLLASRNSWLSTILDSIPDGVVVTDHLGVVCFVNAVAAQLVGLTADEITGRSVADAMPLIDESTRQPTDHPVLTVLGTGQRLASPTLGVLAKPDGTTLSVAGSVATLRNERGKVIGVVMAFGDAARRRLVEEAQLQLAKMKSLEVLAGGLAHDFNNLLAVILSYAQLAHMRHQSRASVQAYLQNIIEAAEQASVLTQQIQTFAGYDHVELVPLNLPLLVEETVHLLSATIPEEIRLTCRTTEPTPLILGNPGRLYRLITSVVTNACEALDEADSGSGEVLLRVERAELPQEVLDRAKGSPDLAPGSYVVLEIEDNGCGMAPDIQQRMFDPFFTTKFTGRGLGLAAALGNMRHHRGAIEVESVPGRGTRLRLLFPHEDGAAAGSSR